MRSSRDSRSARTSPIRRRRRLALIAARCTPSRPGQSRPANSSVTSAPRTLNGEVVSPPTVAETTWWNRGSDAIVAGSTCPARCRAISLTASTSPAVEDSSDWFCSRASRVAGVSRWAIWVIACSRTPNFASCSRIAARCPLAAPSTAVTSSMTGTGRAGVVTAVTFAVTGPADVLLTVKAHQPWAAPLASVLILGPGLYVAWKAVPPAAVRDTRPRGAAREAGPDSGKFTTGIQSAR